jgi:hypothetical protein
MKIDSEFIKQILITMEDNEDYIINSHELMEKLKIKSRKAERKFMGHILILGDEKLIEAINAKYPFGFVYAVEGAYSIADTGYRLTSKGHEIIRAFNKK